MVQYRTFRNDDPPALVEIWNEAFAGRGAVILRTSSPLEHYVFSKPYFDPGGLFVALDGTHRIGFAHAGFGPDQTGARLDRAAGVTCAVAVRPEYQRRGVGSALLERCESYVRNSGTTALYAGGMPGRNPFYLGLYGGADSPGFLASDQSAAPFFAAHGYVPERTRLVFQRRLEAPVRLVDARQPGLRRRYEIRAELPARQGSWWEDCLLGCVEPVLGLFAVDSTSGERVARARVWDMEGFRWRWGVPSAGLLDIEVAATQRRRGLARLVLVGLVRQLQEQFFGLVEAHTDADDAAAVSLLRSFGFEQVDAGTGFRRAGD